MSIAWPPKVNRIFATAVKMSRIGVSESLPGLLVDKGGRRMVSSSCGCSYVQQYNEMSIEYNIISFVRDGRPESMKSYDKIRLTGNWPRSWRQQNHACQTRQSCREPCRWSQTEPRPQIYAGDCIEGGREGRKGCLNCVELSCLPACCYEFV